MDHISHDHCGDYMTFLPLVCAYRKCLCVRACCIRGVVLLRYMLTQGLQLQVAPGVGERFASCRCLSVRCTQTRMHTHKCIVVHAIPYICMRAYVDAHTAGKFMPARSRASGGRVGRRLDAHKSALRGFLTQLKGLHTDFSHSSCQKKKILHSLF